MRRGRRRSRRRGGGEEEGEGGRAEGGGGVDVTMKGGFFWFFALSHKALLYRTKERRAISQRSACARVGIRGMEMMEPLATAPPTELPL